MSSIRACKSLAPGIKQGKCIGLQATLETYVCMSSQASLLPSVYISSQAHKVVGQTWHWFCIAVEGSTCKHSPVARHERRW